MQAGDVVTTFADTSELRDEFAFMPSTELKNGVKSFIDWYTKYHA